jgi:uncharacterized protein YkwD
MTALLLAPPAARLVGRRRLSTLVALASAAAVALAGLVAAPAAHADSGSEQAFVSSINSARASAGRPSLATSGDLTSVARSWAATMASSGTLKHNPNLTTQVNGWRYVGENVGVGGDVASLHRAFMNSPAHKANILDRDYTQIGLGVVVTGGRMWVVEVFRQPMSTSSASRVLSAKSSQQRVYRVGSRGSTVKKIQRVVGVRQDGVFGPRTRAAVMRWQKRHHYRVNGFVTAATRRAMHI